jgi:uncharacterized RDD family membrane protein YckC
MQSASLFRRFGAFVHEAFFLVAFVFIVELGITRLAGGELKGLWRNISQVALFLAIGAYFIWQWTGGRRTLAQKTWQLRLQKENSGNLSLGTSVSRYVAAWIGPALALGAYTAVGKLGLWLMLFNFVWALIDREKQFLHDRIAHTQLVVAERQS